LPLTHSPSYSLAGFGSIPGGMVDLTLAGVGNTEVFDRIQPSPSQAKPLFPGEWRFYYRSVAILALAEALTE
jgi:hypothetical protein